ncbi:hypothetical protein ACPA9J_27050 [Pseudomonas aeruginosa]
MLEPPASITVEAAARPQVRAAPPPRSTDAGVDATAQLRICSRPISVGIAAVAPSSAQHVLRRQRRRRSMRAEYAALRIRCARRRPVTPLFASGRSRQ